MKLLRWVWLICLLCSAEAYAAYCSDIWTQAIKPNSTVPSTLTLPGTPNPSFPQPLQATDYYYPSGNYYIENNVVRTTVGATTRIFVDGNLTINNNVQLNAGGAPQNLILVVTGNLVLSNNVFINGFILAGGSVQLYNNVVINGALTAKGAVANFGGIVNYQPDAIPFLVGGIVCDAGQQSTTLLAHYPLDLCAASTISVIEDLTGKYPATAVNVGAQSNGKVLEAADLSTGPGDFIDIPAGTLNGLSNFSVSLWFNLDTGSGFRELMSASSLVSNSELEIYVNSSNEVRVGLKGAYYGFTGGSSSSVVSNNTWYQLTLTRSGTNLCLYLNNNLVRCVSASSSAFSVARAAIGTWWLADGSTADDFRGDIDEVLIFNQPLTLTQIQQMYNYQNAGLVYDGSSRTSKCTQCLSDSFSSSLSENWVATRSSGNFTPQVINGRLRMTEAAANQSTSATYQRLYPATDNLVVIEFDYWAYGGTGADGLAVVLSDATITPQSGAFGGPLGYGFKPGIPGFAGGWLGFGLDEYGNFSAEGGSSNLGPRRQSVAVRGSGSEYSGYNYLKGSCNNGTVNSLIDCLTPPVDQVLGLPHRYRFIIDSRNAGSTFVSAERDTGSGFTTLIAPFDAQSQPGQAPLPENFLLSLTGSTGDATNIHELDNVRICALRSAPVGTQIDHFEFDYSGQALTCKPETFTVRACKNASCSELVTEQVSATLSPINSGNVNWLGGNIVNFSGGQTTVSLRRTETGITTIGVTGSVPAAKPLSQTLCRAGAGSLTAAACNINFADSGLVFEVPDGIANLPQQNILLSAVRKDDATQQCVPEFANSNRSVQFWSDYITPGPDNRIASEAVSVNTTNIGLSEAQASAQLLSFNAQGQATLTVNYPDAGLVQLNARYVGSVANADAGLIMQGADQFIRRPLGLCIQTGGECAAADSSCAKFAVAGEAFTLTVSAHRYESTTGQYCTNPVTPSFSQNGIALNHQLLAPATGESGVIATSSYNHQASASGQIQVPQSISEVGVFQFGTNAFNYLGMADAVPAASSTATGRFVPASFSLNAGLAVPACGSFSYFAQPSISTAFTLSARNLSGQVTQNYQDAFARLDVGLWSDLSASEGLRFAADLPAGAELMAGALAPVGSWVSGEAEIIATHIVSRPSAPAAPFALTVLAEPVDSDGVTAPSSAVNSAATELRYGRLVLGNTAGPEEEPLPLMFNTEYWQGERFERNQADNCSLISANNTLLTTIDGTPALSLAGQNALIQQGVLPAKPVWLSPVFSSGYWTIEYQTDPWLQYYWRGNTVDYQQDPRAEVIFGRFRGNPRQIFWREVFQ